MKGTLKIVLLAQRVVRKICGHCQVAAAEARESMLQLAGDLDATVIPSRGVGCPECRMTGYQGRIGIFEFMEIGDDIRSLIQQRCNPSEIRAVARKHGMKLLRENGFEKICTGQTTVEEVVRVSMEAS